MLARTLYPPFSGHASKNAWTNFLCRSRSCWGVCCCSTYTLVGGCERCGNQRKRAGELNVEGACAVAPNPYTRVYPIMSCRLIPLSMLTNTRLFLINSVTATRTNTNRRNGAKTNIKSSRDKACDCVHKPLAFIRILEVVPVSSKIEQTASSTSIGITIS